MRTKKKASCNRNPAAKVWRYKLLHTVYLPELFPTDLRASGIGMAIAASRLGSAAGTFVLPVVVAAYGVRTALGALVCYWWAPETKNSSLELLDHAAAGETAQ